MEPNKHAELVAFGFPSHIINYLEGFCVDEVEISQIIDFLQEKGILAIEEGQGLVTFSFLDEESLNRRADFETAEQKGLSHSRIKLEWVSPESETLKNAIHDNKETTSGDPSVELPAKLVGQSTVLATPLGSDTLQGDSYDNEETTSFEVNVSGDLPVDHPVKLVGQSKDSATPLGSDTLQGDSYNIEDTTSGDPPVDLPAKLVGQSIQSKDSAMPLGSKTLQESFTQSSTGHAGTRGTPGGFPVKFGVHSAKQIKLIASPGSDTLQDGAGAVPPGCFVVKQGGRSLKQGQLITCGQIQRRETFVFSS